MTTFVKKNKLNAVIAIAPLIGVIGLVFLAVTA